MNIAELAKEIAAVAVTGETAGEAIDVTHDSRACLPGTVFVAICGEKVDAHCFIPDAISQGAVAVISERKFSTPTVREGNQYPDREGGSSKAGSIAPAWIEVEDARAALAHAAAAVHAHPSRRLKLVGVTGTNGKTTTAHLIDSIIRAAEGTSAMFGTIHHRIGEEALAARHTTPEAADIQRMLAQAVGAGCRSAVMEVSSHAIELRRAHALRFAAAIFTNFTRDHLDYHRTMEDYFAAKEKLFTGVLGQEPGAAIINIDDEYGRKLLQTAKGRTITYGFRSDADVRTDGFTLSSSGTNFTAFTPAGAMEIASPLVGRPHVYNILAAIATGLALSFDLEDITRGVAANRSVAGRFERVHPDDSSAPGFTVIVDYAHTDDALKNVLQTAREIVSREQRSRGAGVQGCRGAEERYTYQNASRITHHEGRVITVFGCGGDRDRTKRAPMGEIAARLSDVVIVTSDNPRSEDPEAIIRDIEAGLKNAGRPYSKFTDRREAIFYAIGKAREGDVVVIAGKGHETYQILGDRTIHFDDREVAREAMRASMREA
ncbi:MAG: UDP-N-acetylmuramoyl-L-alanyl-D-glutamate--2,6-diaminopimelate ligase [Blastocatellia bacterium]|nr:UDP-N-acetylmuramoyl-L-alanyl-D-glutamate--2,6-diaminopimelate ligase [Blastocatellia bacterium]